jgi:hypothetical protein
VWILSLPGSMMRCGDANAISVRIRSNGAALESRSFITRVFLVAGVIHTKQKNQSMFTAFVSHCDHPTIVTLGTSHLQKDQGPQKQRTIAALPAYRHPASLAFSFIQGPPLPSACTRGILITILGIFFFFRDLEDPASIIIGAAG